MLFNGDTFAVESCSFRLEVKPDDSGGLPWDNCTPLAEVTKWTNRDKVPGELIVAEDRGNKRFYDFAAACANLRSQGVKRKDAPKYAREEFESFRRWCADQWYYVGVVVTLLDDDEEPTRETESLWALQSDSDESIEEAARECAAELLARDNDESEEREFCAIMGIPTAPQMLQTMGQV